MDSIVTETIKTVGGGGRGRGRGGAFTGVAEKGGEEEAIHNIKRCQNFD